MEIFVYKFTYTYILSFLLLLFLCIVSFTLRTDFENDCADEAWCFSLYRGLFLRNCFIILLRCVRSVYESFFVERVEVGNKFVCQNKDCFAFCFANQFRNTINLRLDWFRFVFAKLFHYFVKPCEIGLIG